MSSIRSAALLTACLVALCVQEAAAQQAVPATAAVEVPASTCKNPGFVPLDKSGPEMGRFQKRFDEYKVCVQSYVEAIRAKAAEFDAQTRAYSDAGNKTIDEYNNYVNALNDSNKAKPAPAKN